MDKKTRVDRRHNARVRLKPAALQGDNGALYQDLNITVSAKGQENTRASFVNLSQQGLCIKATLSVKVAEKITVSVLYRAMRYDLRSIVSWVNSNGSETLIGINVENQELLMQLGSALVSNFATTQATERRQSQKPGLKKDTADQDIRIVRIPHDKEKDYEPGFVDERRTWLEEQAGAKLSHVSKYTFDPKDVKGNIENLVGGVQLPLGLIGPLKVNGEFAKDTYYVPFATTEGGLISTYQRGAIAITKAGGATVRVYRDQNNLDPVFIFKNLIEADNFVKWITAHNIVLRAKVSEVTNHGKLRNISPIVIGRRVILTITYSTEDAMGANMINIATENICKFITSQVLVESYLLRSNFSSEKKASGVNLSSVYGKEVMVEAMIPQRIVEMFLSTTPKAIANAWHSWALSSFHAAMFGMNGHLANGLAALYIACGQDVAHITNASVGINMFESTDDNNLYVAVKLPNLIVGTVGGGTHLPTQRECLELLGCFGRGKAKKFAEIVAATLLAGELGICAGLTSGTFLAPHVRAAAYTRAKAYETSNHS
jgi:hydroxymethylglutaryl-CoA reductase (NADPH)